MTLHPDKLPPRRSAPVAMASPTPVTFQESCVRTAGERLAWLRKKAGLQFQDVTARTAISKSELSRIENNTRPLSRAHRTLLAKAYGIDGDALDEILGFNPARDYLPPPPVNGSHGDGLFRPRRQMPYWNASACRDPAVHPQTLTLAIDLPLSADGYAIRLDEGLGDFLPENALIVVDPAARPVIGDLVTNRLDASILLMTLARDDSGILTGRCNDIVRLFPPQTRVTDFHKVVAVFPAMHLVCL